VSEQPLSPGERVAAQLEAVVFRRLAANELILPVLSSQATRCLDLIRKPDYSVTKVAEVIETDPILAARILRVVNSAAVGARQPVTSIQAAVARLGSRGVYSAVVEATAASVIDSRDKRIARATKGLWQHSIAVAAGARTLATLVGAGDPEEAYLAGLLHDIGKPVLAVLLLDAEKQVTARSTRGWIDSDEWTKAINRSHRTVGVAVATKWSLPERTIKAIAESGDYDASERRSVANIVRFTNALAKQQGISVGPVDEEDVKALIMIGQSMLELDEEAVKRVANSMVEKVDPK
jgi:putative nucleotidyltransferase with HDIG domain